MARNTKGKAKIVQQNEYKRLIKVVSQSTFPERDTLLVYFSFGLGLRAMEMAGLKIRDVIDDSGNIYESVSLQKAKNNKSRELYLTDPKLRKAIQAYIEWRKKRAEEKRQIFSREQPLFLSQKGHHFSNVSMGHVFKKIYGDAGILGTSHSGRRTFATNLIEKGIDIKSLQLLMGHENIQQTAKYVEGNPERLKKFSMLALY